MQFTFYQKRVGAWALIAAFVAITLWLLAPVLTPFVVAAVLAYALNPVVNWLDTVGRGRLPRLLAVIVVELVFILAVLSVMLLIIPILAKEMPLLREQVPVLLDSVNNSLKPFLAQFGVKLSLDVNNVKGFVLKYLNANFEDAFSSVLSSLKLGGSVAFAIIGNAVLIPVALFYLLMDWDRFVLKVLELVPPRLRGCCRRRDAGAGAGAAEVRRLGRGGGVGGGGFAAGLGDPVPAAGGEFAGDRFRDRPL